MMAHHSHRGASNVYLWLLHLFIETLGKTWLFMRTYALSLACFYSGVVIILQCRWKSLSIGGVH